MRLLAKFRLWWRGYCTKHGTEKNETSGPGGLSRWCAQCEIEKGTKDAQIIKRCREILGFQKTDKV